MEAAFTENIYYMFLSESYFPGTSALMVLKLCIKNLIKSNIS